MIYSNFLLKAVVGNFFSMEHNVGSYTQGRIAGDFLSSRKTA